MESKDTNNLNIKITDFGFACFYNPLEEGVQEVLGSPLYMAPEIIREEKYNEKVDIWSVGIVTYILLSGRPPFNGKVKQDIFNSILQNEVNFDTCPIFQKVSEEAKDFIKLALTKDMNKRPSAKVLLEHDWIQKTVKQPEIDRNTQLDVAGNL